MTSTLFAFEYVYAVLVLNEGVVFGNIWNIEDTLHVSLGRRKKDLRTSLKAGSLVAFPVLIVSVHYPFCLSV